MLREEPPSRVNPPAAWAGKLHHGLDSCVCTRTTAPRVGAAEQLLQALRNVVWGGQRAGNLTNQSFLTKGPDLV